MSSTGNGAIGDATDGIKRAARTVHASRSYRFMVRGGLVAFGIVHLLVGYLAGQLALGSVGEDASQVGALRQLAQYPMGKVLLGAVAVGFAVITVWMVFTTFIGWRQFTGWKRWQKRASSVGRAVVYGVLGVQAARIALGLGAPESGETQSSITSQLLSAPWGQVLVVAVGLVIVAVGGSQIWKGMADKFLDDLEGRPGKAGTWLARIGHVAKGLVVAVIGVLFVVAAFTLDPETAGGMGEALEALRSAPFGEVVLTATAVGLAAYGLYCFFWARRASF